MTIYATVAFLEKDGTPPEAMASYGSQQYQQQQQQQQHYQQQQQQQVPLSPGLGPGQTQLLLQSPKKPGVPPESSVVQPPPPPVPLNMEGKTLLRLNGDRNVCEKTRRNARGFLPNIECNIELGLRMLESASAPVGDAIPREVLGSHASSFSIK